MFRGFSGAFNTFSVLQATRQLYLWKNASWKVLENTILKTLHERYSVFVCQSNPFSTWRLVAR
jgi:hypothetical protein